jgi:hypothetical protein
MMLQVIIGGDSVWIHRLLPRLRASGINVGVHEIPFGGQPGANCIPVQWTPLQQQLPYALFVLLFTVARRWPPSMELNIEAALGPSSRTFLGLNSSEHVALTPKWRAAAPTNGV